MAWWDEPGGEEYYAGPSPSYDYDLGNYELGDLSAYLQDNGGFDPSAWSYDMPSFAPQETSAFEGQFTMPSPQVDLLDQQGNMVQTMPENIPRAMSADQKANEIDTRPGQAGKPESMLSRGVRSLTEAKPGTLAQGALGLGGLGLMAAGLAKKTPSVRYPGRNVQLSPQEQAAANALAAERARASGTLASRGYAGEEGIRDTVNKQLQAALEGNTDLVSPETTRRITEARVQLQDRLRRELGPGWETSTAGLNAMKNMELQWAAILDAERKSALNALNAMGLSRSQFTNQLQMQPGQLAGAELGALSNIGTQDAALRAQIEAANAGMSAAEKQALLQTGGQATGMAISPWLYQMMLQNVQQAR